MRAQRSFILLLIAFVVPVVRATLLDRILAALQNATDCASCHSSVLPPFQELARLGDNAFVSAFTQICEILEVSPYPCISV